jgi:hypothetical protein
MLYAQAEGLSAIPVTDLGSIITRIAATRLAKGQAAQLSQDQQQAQQLLEAAPADAPAQVDSLPAIVQEAMPQAWKALALCAGKMVEMFRPIAFVENKDTDTQVSRTTAQTSTDQYSTVQYSTVQYSTVQYSTVQWLVGDDPACHEGALGSWARATCNRPHTA